MSDSSRCIAIIGAGFSGTVTAANLLRQVHSAPVRIVLIDRQRLGRGTAYAALSSPFLLNVPAGRMSALSGDPQHFLRFAQGRLPATTGDDFVPRSLYGDYLEDLLAAAERGAAPHVRLERVQGVVLTLDIWRPAHTFILGMEGGQEIIASEVVLALGNPAPALLPATDALRSSGRLVENPWCEKGAVAAEETVLAVGTGLTMADIVASTMQSGRRSARVVHAISRHGLVPPRQTAFRNANAEFDPQPLLHAAGVSLRQLFRQVRNLARDAERRGGDWREAITFVRTLAPRLWAKLSVPERRRFLRHARAYWDIHRHRLAPGTRAALDELRTARRLVVHAGHIQHLDLEGDQVRVIWRARGQEHAQTMLVDRVINCTGPDYRCRSSGDPLLQHLIANGLIQPDALNIGLRTAPTGGVMTLLGHVARNLYYIGPMLRADHWEVTAVAELRERAESLALHLVRATDAPAAIKSVS